MAVRSVARQPSRNKPLPRRMGLDGRTKAVRCQARDEGSVGTSRPRAEDDPMTCRGVSPHVVIVGVGFGGLYAARALIGHPVRVTLLDLRNHHLFQPLLYQVATAALNPSDIATPLRSILRRARNVTVLLAEVQHVDLAARCLTLDRGEIGYEPHT